MWLYRPEIAVLNAFYAKKEGRLSYEEIRKFSNILINKFDKEHIPFIFGYEGDGDPIVTFDGVKYICLSDEIILCNSITEDIINKVNSIYDEKMQRLIVEAREEYLKKENNTRKKSTL